MGGGLTALNIVEVLMTLMEHIKEALGDEWELRNPKGRRPTEEALKKGFSADDLQAGRVETERYCQENIVQVNFTLEELRIMEDEEKIDNLKEAAAKLRNHGLTCKIQLSFYSNKHKCQMSWPCIWVTG